MGELHGMSVFWSEVVHTRKEGEGVAQGLKAALADQWGRAQGQTPVFSRFSPVWEPIFLTLGIELMSLEILYYSSSISVWRH